MHIKSKLIAIVWPVGGLVFGLFVGLKTMYVIAHGLQTHDGYIPDSLRPKFKSQSQINIWDLVIKA